MLKDLISALALDRVSGNLVVLAVLLNILL